LKNFAFETWDEGRLTVNRQFAMLLQNAGLTTFDALMNHQGGALAKNLHRERTTTRFVLPDAERGEQAFYIKRHGPAPWKEYIKPLLRLTRPLWGARPEWEAILRFHEAGIPTMTPVALGEAGGRSLIVTQALEGCTKLSHWMEAHAGLNGSAAGANGRAGRETGHLTRQTGRVAKQNGNAAANGRAAANGANPHSREIVQELARVARTMHEAGMHHQDFYLTHLLIPDEGPSNRVYVIDLGRVRQRRRLSRRWVVKDLAQLNYSAHLAGRSSRARFLRAYLGRPLEAGDRALMRRIERKSRAIARHSARHGL